MPANLSFAGMARSYTAFVGCFSVRPDNQRLGRRSL